MSDDDSGTCAVETLAPVTAEELTEVAREDWFSPEVADMVKCVPQELWCC